MSKEVLTIIISRCLTDAAYRQQLMSDPDMALGEYELDEEETRMVRSLPADAFDELTMDLEDRQSKSGFLGGLSLFSGKDGAVDASSVVDLLTRKYGGR